VLCLLCLQLVASTVVAMLSGQAIAVKTALAMYRGRRALLQSHADALFDTVCVLATTMGCNSILGTCVFPLTWTVLLEHTSIPVGMDAIYFALLSPLLTSLLFRVVSVEPARP
jgi:hypothetical protein